MSLFWSKKQKAEKNYDQAAPKTKAVAVKADKKPAKSAAAKAAVKTPVPVLPIGHLDASTVSIIRPRVTEKSGFLSQGGVYTFQVLNNANKQSVIKAIAAMYKVTPRKVAMINTPTKTVFVRGKWGKVAGIKKALVTLKKGDKIDFV